MLVSVGPTSLGLEKKPGLFYVEHIFNPQRLLVIRALCTRVDRRTTGPPPLIKEVPPAHVLGSLDDAANFAIDLQSNFFDSNWYWDGVDQLYKESRVSLLQNGVSKLLRENRGKSQKSASKNQN